MWGKEMKKYSIGVIIILSFLLYTCASQRTVPIADRQYQIITFFQEKNKGEIFDSALRGLAYVFNSPKSVIQYQNRDEGQIVIKGYMDVIYTIQPVPTKFTLTIEIKDGKMRSTFTNIGFDSWVPFDNQGQLDIFSAQAKNLIVSLEKKMNEKTNDW